MVGTASLPTGDAKRQAVRAMFDAIAPRYDLVNRVMTFGLDVGWRRRTVAALALRPGSIVVDIACGTGDLCRQLTKAGLRPVGIDFSPAMLAAARTAGPLVQADALCLPLADATADGVTCGFALRNLVDLDPFLTETARVLRTGGRLALLEVAAPDRALLRWGHRVYFDHVVPRIGALLSDADAYAYLPRSVAYLPQPNRLLAMVGDVGFERVEHRLLIGGAAQLITGTRR